MGVLLCAIPLPEEVMPCVFDKEKEKNSLEKLVVFLG